MKRGTIKRSAMALCATIAAVFSITLAWAAPPPGKGGGNGGGGDGGGASYTIVHLETGLSTEISGIHVEDLNEYDPLTDHQDVVGRIFDADGNNHPLFWIVEGETVTPILLSGGNGAEPVSVNDHDEVVGLDELNRTPLYWPDPLSEPIILPLLEGHDRGTAFRINNQSVVVGQSSDSEVGTHHPVAWQIAYVDGELVVSSPIDLGTLVAGGWGGSAIDVADTDELTTRVVGIAADEEGNTRSVMWEMTNVLDDQGNPELTVQSGPADLGALPGDAGNTARAMNNQGDVCGSPGSLTLYGLPMIALANPKPNENGLSEPNDINDSLEIVGQHFYGTGESMTVLWQADGATVDLNKSAKGTEWADLADANAINNHGAIAGWGARYLNGKKNSPKVRAAYIMLPQ
jgi:hypothetical protein